MLSLIAWGNSPAMAATGPDLSITRSSNTAVFGNASTVVSLTVKNLGNAPAPTVALTYAPGQPVLSPLTSGYVCGAILKGHSGRGGGYSRVGWSCVQTPAVALAPGASVVVSFNVIYPFGTFNEVWTASAGSTAQLNLVSHTAAAVVVSSLPPIPWAPTGVTVSQSGDSLVVNWQAPGVGGTAVTSSKIIATPTSGVGTAILTATVTGPVTSALVPGVAPLTSYSVTVQSSDSAGTGPASFPALFMSQASSMPPGAPTGVHTWWIGTELAVAWTAPVPGDSPVDDYQVSVTDSDGLNVMSDSGTGTEDVLTVDFSQDYFTIIVRAHNASGWGKWSAPITQGGL